ncbi:hypothetical protein FNV43_RR01248 [Rhamnella rubrinervis]|uniref:Uncharacterized protein n=1 Tax=Rhamnella rubrinervis TaxID=2594499 RepID=A0A8K0HQL6_9ROSA|nr:hypothetical protein FNV43_RR01248 [Rhamnella rubrinervis]
MYGNPSRFRPSGGGAGGRRQQPSPFHPTNPNDIYLQSPPFQNHRFPTNFPVQGSDFSMLNHGFPVQQFPGPNFQPQNPRELLEKVDRAVSKARRDLLAAGESVSAWKVSQSALLMLQVDCWGSLGFRMQQVPSLHSLIVIEGKMNAFIHCFVAVRRITSLHDLEVAICNNEAIGKFEELELGPFLRHPLVQHYFSVNLDTTEVFKITSEEIITLLCEFMDTCKNKDIVVDEFLYFISEKRSVSGKEKLGIRIQSLGMHISAIRRAKNSENGILKKHKGTFKPKHDKECRKFPLSSSQKKILDERFCAISERVENFSSVNKDFCGKHIRFGSLSSEDEQSDDCMYEDDNDSVIGSHVNFSSPSIRNSDRVSSCPYPSATEEMKRLGLKDKNCTVPSPADGIQRQHYQSSGPARKKRKYENLNCTTSAPPKLQKKDMVKVGVLPIETGHETKEFNYISGADSSVSNDSLRMFVSTWKEMCQEHTVTEVILYMVACKRYEVNMMLHGFNEWHMEGKDLKQRALSMVLGQQRVVLSDPTLGT